MQGKRLVNPSLVTILLAIIVGICTTAYSTDVVLQFGMISPTSSPRAGKKVGPAVKVGLQIGAHRIVSYGARLSWSKFTGKSGSYNPSIASLTALSRFRFLPSKTNSPFFQIECGGNFLNVPFKGSYTNTGRFVGGLAIGYWKAPPRPHSNGLVIEVGYTYLKEYAYASVLFGMIF